jgi:hypothetical protein
MENGLLCHQATLAVTPLLDAVTFFVHCMMGLACYGLLRMLPGPAFTSAAAYLRHLQVMENGLLCHQATLANTHVHAMVVAFVDSGCILLLSFDPNSGDGERPAVPPGHTGSDASAGC